MDNSTVSRVKRLESGKSAPYLIFLLERHEVGDTTLVRPDPWRTLDQKHSYVAADPDQADPSHVRAICANTRHHLLFQYSDSLILDEDSGSDSAQARVPLEMYRRAEYQWPQSEGDVETAQFHGVTTGNSLTITIEPPYLPSQLIDRVLKLRRGPLWGSTDRPTPYTTFAFLRTYAFNVLHKGEDRTINATPGLLFSKKVGLDAEIIELMGLLYFTYDEETARFYPPTSKDSDMQRNLEKAIVELSVLSCKVRNMGIEADKKELFSFSLRPISPVLRFVSRCASYPRYKSTLGSQTHNVQREDSLFLHPAFCCLGLPSDAADGIVNDYYSLQVQFDPDNAPIYLDALSAIANIRSSQQLRIRVAEEKERGIYPMSEFHDAIRFFGMTEESVEQKSDQDLILLYDKVMNEQPGHEKAVRGAFKIIGSSRRSSAIQKHLDSTLQEFYRVEEAYKYLGVSEDQDPSTIYAAFVARHADGGEDSRKATAALSKISQHLGNDSLLELDELKALGDSENTDMSLDSAFRRLNVDNHSATDDLLIEIYAARIQERPDSLQSLQQALRKIGEARNSQIILGYLDTGNRNAPRPKATPGVPIGLENIGNTCYLNSLLQYYFTITPVRQLVLNMKDKSLLANEDDIKRVGGRRVMASEIRRARKFVYQLRMLFQDLQMTEEAAIRPSKELARLALINARDDVDEAPAQEEEDSPARGKKRQMGSQSYPASVNNESIKSTAESGGVSLLDMDIEQNTVTNQSTDVVEHVENAKDHDAALSQDWVNEKEAPKDVENSSNTNIEMDRQENEQVVEGRESDNVFENFGLQQDASECIDNVIFQLSAALKATDFDANGEQWDALKKLFTGELKQVISDGMDGPKSNSTKPSIKTEYFNQLIVSIGREGQNLYNALDILFDPVTVELDGGQKTKYVFAARLPPIIQIQIQRTQFDRQRGVYKSNAYLKFEDRLYMDRYLDTEDSEKRQHRKRAYALKSELERLESRLGFLNGTSSPGVGGAIPDVIHETISWLDGLESINPDLQLDSMTRQAMKDRKAALESEISALTGRVSELRAEIEKQYEIFDKDEYLLHSVFIHRGSAEFGHYWIYIRNFEKGAFYKYNDEYVTQVSDDEVFADLTGNTANPYMLTYVRKELPDGRYGPDVLLETGRREQPSLIDM